MSGNEIKELAHKVDKHDMRLSRIEELHTEAITEMRSVAKEISHLASSQDKANTLQDEFKNQVQRRLDKYEKRQEEMYTEIVSNRGLVNAVKGSSRWLMGFVLAIAASAISVLMNQ